MNIPHLFELANDSGGTLYLMLLLLLVALTVIIERTSHLSNMQQGGEQLIAMLKKEDVQLAIWSVPQKLSKLPHIRLFNVLKKEPVSTDRETFGGHLEEAIMHEVPILDRSLWVLDTVITLAPLLGLFGTIIGMFNAFHVLGDAQNGAAQITGGIAEALIATASGLLIAMIGLVFFNALHTRVRIVLHQLETIKIMLVNRHDRLASNVTSLVSSGTSHVKSFVMPVRA
ncbi:MotA/TolQ/ExbB proton channel family protein [Glaciimonas immobilis]|uniref:Biopolymer transport protein ExbB n=1 Tax=Glaciimonas immobilis TaxID=728004 RepID=A0A840RRH9_9BURK|nr:MotA/TolQ/ExbB proton channel family protein [Glaciimonas immobilis]KAF3998110.1 MotA/TolQ/ExbB proton channel family protein [Glaciimonas immobilis]MBB5199190.1 biopolymer transport protein ExbB [Glaciimonas immobilis]